MYGLEVFVGGTASLMSGPSTSVLVRLGASVGYACTASGRLIGIGAGEPWRLVTPIFLHGSLIHLALNGYALWIFGNIVEQELGKARYLVIFLVGGCSRRPRASSSGSYDAGGRCLGRDLRDVRRLRRLQLAATRARLLPGEDRARART